MLMIATLVLPQVNFCYCSAIACYLFGQLLFAVSPSAHLRPFVVLEQRSCALSQISSDFFIMCFNRPFVVSRLVYSRDLQIFLQECHISCNTTVRRPGILRNVIVSGYVTYYQINKFLVYRSTIFFLVDKMSFQPDEMA